ncbi:MAG TPA: hypothetical protein VF181_10345 [Balneolaceae bacterium]
MKKLIALFTTCIVVAGITSCDVAGEQNYEYTPGDSLLIVGPVAFATTTPVDSVFVGDTASFYLQAFTILKDYTWTVNGSAPFDVRRNGGFADVIFDTPGVYEVRVEDGEYVGTVTVTAFEPTP